MSVWGPPGPPEDNNNPSPGQWPSSGPPYPGQPPQYGQPQYGQPQYGQPQFGQPQFGQPQFGQPQFGQPQFGQPQFGQPQYGQPQYGQPQYGQPYPGQPPPGPPGAYGGYQGPPMPPPGDYGPTQPGGYGPTGAARASMDARFGGLVIDTILLAIVSVIVGTLTGAFSNTTSCDSSGDCTKGFHLGSNAAVDIVGLIVGVLYWGLLVGVRTQTLGHRVAGIKVIDLNTGGPIGFGRGALRWLVMTITGLVCTLGYWSPFFDDRRRGWHDKASTSMVVRTR